jgi:DNA repair exonuclease SbcCD ATPase subunit
VIPQTIPASPSPVQSLPAHRHLHIEGEICPLCEQEIPPERLKEIRGKIAAKQREQNQAIALRLQQQFAIEKAEAEAQSRSGKNGFTLRALVRGVGA